MDSFATRSWNKMVGTYLAHFTALTAGMKPE
ncbi:hypothetical protein PBAL39_16911 [Pedobacter sp. BAL39]|nr:hypothetical protein PBAL39_16911 [Pedobacter sp. BAL39]